MKPYGIRADIRRGVRLSAKIKLTQMFGIPYKYSQGGQMP